MKVFQCFAVLFGVSRVVGVALLINQAPEIAQDLPAGMRGLLYESFPAETLGWGSAAGLKWIFVFFPICCCSAINLDVVEISSHMFMTSRCYSWILFWTIWTFMGVSSKSIGGISNYVRLKGVNVISVSRSPLEQKCHWRKENYSLRYLLYESCYFPKQMRSSSWGAIRVSEANFWF